jgi:hypothetical protein
MKQMCVSESGAALADLTVGSPRPERIASATLVYHDSQTHAWAREAYERIRRLAGENTMRATWWKISDLIEPGVLAGAVSTAMRADVIVVAIHAEEALPVPFRVWVDTWLPNRLRAGGRLVALIGGAAQANAESNRVREYLRAVARQGRMEFRLEERQWPVEPTRWSWRPVPFSRSNLHPIGVEAVVGIGRGIVHRAA